MWIHLFFNINSFSFSKTSFKAVSFPFYRGGSRHGPWKKPKLQPGQTELQGLKLWCSLLTGQMLEGNLSSTGTVLQVQTCWLWDTMTTRTLVWFLSHSFYCWLLLHWSSPWWHHESCEHDALMGKASLSILPLTMDLLVVLKGVLLSFGIGGGGKENQMFYSVVFPKVLINSSHFSSLPLLPLLVAGVKSPRNSNILAHLGVLPFSGRPSLDRSHKYHLLLS